MIKISGHLFARLFCRSNPKHTFFLITPPPGWVITYLNSGKFMNYEAMRMKRNPDLFVFPIKVFQWSRENVLFRGHWHGQGKELLYSTTQCQTQSFCFMYKKIHGRKTFLEFLFPFNFLLSLGDSLINIARILIVYFFGVESYECFIQGKTGKGD